MRILIVAESFLPHMNGVTHSLLRILEDLRRRGHRAMVVAPAYDGAVAGAPARGRPETVFGAPVVRVRSAALPRYAAVRVGFATTGHLEAIMRGFAPDIVHLASPFALGWQAVVAANRLRLPVVAVYQTDVAAYVARYGLAALEAPLWQHVVHLHNRATLTLAPSHPTLDHLASLGVERLRLWARGVDSVRFDPTKRSERLRRALAPSGQAVVGYVGRLAPEKQVADLRVLQDLPGARLVVVGDGPSRPALERALPRARFLGFLGGEELAVAMASFDVFVHPGERETFCQTVNEAMASGVPVVATGVGGPLDLVRNSQTGWLYRPGDLADLRARVADLVGDRAKRAAFGARAREETLGRTWGAVCAQLMGFYAEALAERASSSQAI